RTPSSPTFPLSLHAALPILQFATLFPNLAHVRVTHRWGGLQCFTADDLPVVGLLDPDRSIWGMAGFCGRGNCHSDVGAEFLAGRDRKSTRLNSSHQIISYAV